MDYSWRHPGDLWAKQTPQFHKKPSLLFSGVFQWDLAVFTKSTAISPSSPLTKPGRCFSPGDVNPVGINFSYTFLGYGFVIVCMTY